MDPPPPSRPTLQNHHVDYVIQYSFADTDTPQAKQQLELLLRRLSEVGLQSEVRQGDESSLLVFVRAAKKHRLKRAVYQSRIRDWLHGVRNTEPEPEDSAEPQTESERLRVIHHLITEPRDTGGAEITPKHGEWKDVKAIFPLHDEEANAQCMKKYSSQSFLSAEDMDQIRDKFGESVGFYFSFLQSYFKFLMFPAAFGFACWLLLGSFSIIYTVVNLLWCIIFIEYWKRQEDDLSCRWQTKGVSAVRQKRREFRPEKEVRDESTGEMRGVFPATKRMQRQLLQVPFALLVTVALGVIIATCFAIEIFISEVYNGPLKTYLVFIPTILLSALIPTMSAVLLTVATKLNDYENYATQAAYDIAMTHKTFVINFITSYLPVFLTAFVYVPFGSLIVPYLDVFQLTVRPFVTKEEATTARTDFTIDPDRLRKQVIYFTVTAQGVNFAMEVIVPMAQQKLLRYYKEYMRRKQQKSDNNNNNKSSGSNTPATSEQQEQQQKEEEARTFDDHPDEIAFLKRVRNEADLTDYDVTDDLREMCVQFGYLALFSPVWPLVPVSFLINNWVELRSDFFKICHECKRPSPARADTIGPWLESLGFLSWMGSITSAALLYMFSGGSDGPNGEPTAIQGWALLLAIFFSEHTYLLARYAVQAAMEKLEPPNVRREKAQAYLVRKRYLESTVGSARTSDDEDDAAPRGDGDGKSQAVPDISRQALEEDARNWSAHGTDESERFWMRQKGWRESAHVGSAIITAMGRREEKKEL